MLRAGSRRDAELAAILLPTAALALCMAGEAPAPWRPGAAAVFFLVAPGLAVLAPLRLRLDLELALTVPVGLAVTSLLSLPLFFLRAWSGGSAVAVLVAVCVLGASVLWARSPAPQRPRVERPPAAVRRTDP